MVVEAGYETHWGQETWTQIHRYRIKVLAETWEVMKRVVGRRTIQVKET